MHPSSSHQGDQRESTNRTRAILQCHSKWSKISPHRQVAKWHHRQNRHILPILGITRQVMLQPDKIASKQSAHCRYKQKLTTQAISPWYTQPKMKEGGCWQLPTNLKPRMQQSTSCSSQNQSTVHSNQLPNSDWSTNPSIYHSKNRKKIPDDGSSNWSDQWTRDQCLGTSICQQQRNERRIENEKSPITKAATSSEKSRTIIWPRVNLNHKDAKLSDLCKRQIYNIVT